MQYKQLITLFLFLMISSTLVSQEDKNFEQKVKNAVDRQMEIYPASTLKDVYKNFFQDKFGPGHLIEDPVAAGNYLQRELNSMTHSSGELIEPTGWEGNFYRVNLSLIKDGIIPYDVFFDVFVRSVNSIQPVLVDAWLKEWVKIEAVIKKMYPDLPGYESDKQFLLNQLQEGKYVAHHSELFEAAYSPHYRIVSKVLFEEELLPLLQNYLNSEQAGL